MDLPSHAEEHVEVSCKTMGHHCSRSNILAVDSVTRNGHLPLARQYVFLEHLPFTYTQQFCLRGHFVLEITHLTPL